MGRESLYCFATVTVVALLWQRRAFNASPKPVRIDVSGSEKEEEEKKMGKGEAKQETTLKDSINAYDRHVIIFGAGSNETWPARMESAACTTPSARSNSQGITTELLQQVSEYIKKKAGKGCATNVIITCSSEPSCGELGYYQAIMYPEAIIFQIAPSNLPRFVELCCSPKRNNIDNIDKMIFKVQPTPWKHLIAVCAHTQRDKRCGKAGPQVISKMTTALLENNSDAAGSVTVEDIKVVNTSHIGGHKFAGVCIVYPIAHWYGQVSAKGTSIDRILQEINTNGCVEECRRGTGTLLGW